MTSQAENELLTRVEGDAPMGRLIRENYWIPFDLSSNLVAGAGPTPVRLLGEDFVAFRAEDGRIGFFDELCPHRRASLLLARCEGNGLRCIYHGWKLDVSGRVVEAPTQTVRPEAFAERVRVAHFPVREAGGMAWVWLGREPARGFPEYPFAREGIHADPVLSTMRCNWLQGLEGGLDSAHLTVLHQTWLRRTFESGVQEGSTLDLALAQTPTYEAERAPYGLRAAALRKTPEGDTHVRITEYFMPLVAVVPATIRLPEGVLFAVAPIDDTHHLLFFGNYDDKPPPSQRELAGIRADLDPDPRNFASMEGDRSNRWGQDRKLMESGHFTGFGKTLLEEDAAVQASMGPIVDRTQENLSSSDAAVAQTRRLLLEAIAAVEAGQLPPASARAEIPELPNAREAVLPAGAHWSELTPERIAS